MSVLVRSSTLLLALVVGVLPLAAAQPSSAGSWVCPPCSVDCHRDRHPEAGACGQCGMQLVPIETVPQVGVLLYPGVDLFELAAATGLLQDSRAVRVFTIADTLDPVRVQGVVTAVAEYSFAELPPIDVFVVPGGNVRSTAGDDMVLAAVRNISARARAVVGVGAGSWLLATAGVLGEARITVPSPMVARLQAEYPALTVVGNRPAIRSGRVFTALDGLAALELVPALLAALEKSEEAAAVAARLQIPWPPEPMPEVLSRPSLPAALPSKDPDRPPREGAPRPAGEGKASPVADWPQWRGPRVDNVGADPGWRGDGPPAVLWRAAVGLGHSSVAVVDGSVFTAGHDEEGGVDVVWRIDAASGEVEWDVRYPAQLRALGHSGGTLATPAVHDGRVYLAHREGELRCLSAADGALLWHRALARELGLTGTDYGFGGSAIVVGDTIFYGVADMLALDAETGDLRWRSPDLAAMYSTPAPFAWRGRRLLAAFAKRGLFVLDRADGSAVGFHAWRKGPETVNASTPVVVDDRIFISSGYNHGCALLRIGDDGLIPLWQNRVLRTKLSGAVHFDGHLYGFDEGTLKCVDLAGAERWRKRGLGMGALTLAGDQLVIISARGRLVAAGATPAGFSERWAVDALSGGACWASPVVAGGRVYCRSSAGELVCLGYAADS